MINRIRILYFSPTETTKQVIEEIAAGTGWAIEETCDLTDLKNRYARHVWQDDELVLLGMPVYSGRIPLINDIFPGFQGQNTPVVPVVVYGNRDYDDALLEMKDGLEARGCLVVGAGAFIGTHSFSEEACGIRPDQSDKKIAREFGKALRKKLEQPGGWEENISVKGDYPYKHRTENPQVPTVTSECNNCGICIRECPVRAISPLDPAVTDSMRCLMCFRCVRNCPTGAKKLEGPRISGAITWLKSACSERREPELIL